MSENEKVVLINRLDENHSIIQKVIDGIDLKTFVYPDTNWCVRDILAHISTWDRQVTSSLVAYNDGKEYFIQDLDEDAYNQREVSRSRDKSNNQILAEWEAARTAFIEAIRDIPLEKFPGELLYPWGDERGTIAGLVEYMLDHDIEHRDEIAKAIQVSPD